MLEQLILGKVAYKHIFYCTGNVAKTQIENHFSKYRQTKNEDNMGILGYFHIYKVRNSLEKYDYIII